MPYITEEEREELDNVINEMVEAIKNTKTSLTNPNNLANFLGRINYCFSRVVSSVMGDVSYPKVAMVTGVLENIKQEFYRRIAANYEDIKIKQNGDIKEYKKFPL
jgi:hypothetical protein